jgi:predicted nucleic acid-binding protein
MATMGAEAVFVDTNVLVHANDADSPFHEDARARLRQLESAGGELWINRQVLREYAVVVSRKMNDRNAFDAPTLNADLARFESEFWVADETAAVTEKLRHLIESHNVKGKPVHDANIVATMRVHGVGKLLTGNLQDFVRFVPTIEILPLVAQPANP